MYRVGWMAMGEEHDWAWPIITDIMGLDLHLLIPSTSHKSPKINFYLFVHTLVSFSILAGVVAVDEEGVITSEFDELVPGGRTRERPLVCGNVPLSSFLADFMGVAHFLNRRPLLTMLGGVGVDWVLALAEVVPLPTSPDII